MRYLLLLFTFVITHSIVAQEPPGLVGRWKMDNNCKLTDETASPSNGVLVDMSLSQNRDNVANTALSFPSNTSYITLGVTEKLKLAGDKSISFWIKPVLSGSNRTGSIFSYGTGINIKYEEQGSVTRLNINFGNTSFMLLSLLQNQWQQITITFKKDFSTTKSKVVAYVNGLQTAESEQNKSTHDFANSIALIGPANQNTLTNGFRGSLDDMRVYNRTLTSAESLDLVLPVKLEFFNAKAVKGFIELSWRTNLEENVSHFDLQKSRDGIFFESISKLDAGKYNYLAYDVLDKSSPFAWYRLQIVDRDERKSFSNVIRISSDDTNEANGSAIKLFPNPGSAYINLIGIQGNGSVTIINNSGVIVKQKQFVARNAVNISDLTPGLYYIILFDGNKRMTSKFIKQ